MKISPPVSNPPIGELTTTQPLCNAERLAIYFWKRAWSGTTQYFRVWDKPQDNRRHLNV